MTSTETAGPRPLHTIANEAFADWVAMARNGNHPAHPYADAMRSLTTVNDMYGLDDGRDIVRRFLSNASGWRGETARALKAELKAHLGE